MMPSRFLLRRSHPLRGIDDRGEQQQPPRGERGWRSPFGIGRGHYRARGLSAFTAAGVDPCTGTGSRVGRGSVDIQPIDSSPRSVCSLGPSRLNRRPAGARSNEASISFQALSLVSGEEQGRDEEENERAGRPKDEDRRVAVVSDKGQEDRGDAGGDALVDQGGRCPCRSSGCGSASAR